MSAGLLRRVVDIGQRYRAQVGICDGRPGQGVGRAVLSCPVAVSSEACGRGEMADARSLGVRVRKNVGVQVPPPALFVVSQTNGDPTSGGGHRRPRSAGPEGADAGTTDPVMGRAHGPKIQRITRICASGRSPKSIGRPRLPHRSHRAWSTRWAACVTKSVGPLGRCPNQCFLECSRPSFGIWSVLARFSARFSLRDLPVFLDMLCRGDLSDMTGPFFRGPGWSLSPDHTRTADGEATPVGCRW